MNKEKKEKRKIKRIIIWGIVFALVVSIGVFLWSQRNNLMALRYAQYTVEERQALLEENQARVDEMIEDLPVDPIYPLSDEQAKMLQEGKLSEENALQIIKGNNPSGESEGTTNQTGNNSNLQDLLARVYLLRASYTGQIDGLVGQAKAEYIAQKKETGTASKSAIGAKYMSQGLALEGSCDAEMEALLSEIATEIENTGGDPSIVSQIRSAYNTEKSIKKADLLARYSG